MRHHRLLLTTLCAAALWGVAAQARAQSGIYTCVDAQGRRITADRPIASCMDREQRELSPSGSLKRVVPPVPTANELAAQEARRKAEAEQQSRQLEERRKERALIARYPNEAAHQRERAKALEQVDAVDAAIAKRIQDLGRQRQGIDEEMAFYAKDPSRAPAWLRHKLRDNDQQTAAQAEAQTRQQQERQRVHERFDAELAQLKRLWADTLADPR